MILCLILKSENFCDTGCVRIVCLESWWLRLEVFVCSEEVCSDEADFFENQLEEEIQSSLDETVVIMVGSLSGRWKLAEAQARFFAVVVQGALMRVTVCRRRRRRRPRHDLSHKSRDRRARSRKCTITVSNLIWTDTLLYFHTLGVESIMQSETTFESIRV